jgi:hypothetical protein
VSCGRLPCCTAASLGAVLALTVTLSASAGVRRASAHPELDKTEACIRAALRKEKLAITYIQEGKVSKATIADKVVEPATTDIFTCAAPALKAAEAADEIGEGDAKAVDSDLTNAAAADDDARHFLADRKGKQAIESLEKANSLKEAALSFVEHAAAREPKPSISAIYAVFLPKKLATRYTIHAGSITGEHTFRWTLTLEQIDPDGSSPEGFQSSDAAAPDYSSAGFDPKCNNSILPGGQQSSSGAGRAVYVWSGLLDEFTWYHGDVGSYPGSSYGCNHKKMGARGHQGTVTVVITDGRWVCTASIEGTNLSTVTIHGNDPVCKYNP